MSTQKSTAVKTATLVKKLTGFSGDAALFRLDPPLVETKYDWTTSEDTPTGRLIEFVISSEVDLPSIVRIDPGYRTSETMVFPADGDRVSDWGEIGFVPHKSHADALAGMGYEVAS